MGIFFPRKIKLSPVVIKRIKEKEREAARKKKLQKEREDAYLRWMRRWEEDV